MIRFTDILYGSLELPDWMRSFIGLPEFVRLRNVRLSNVDSYQFKDFGGPSRWEHSIAVAWLAMHAAERRKLPLPDTIHLALAGLLHDVATPPFGHTVEYVLEAFDHELESQRLLAGMTGRDTYADMVVYESQLPRFAETCRKLSRTLKTSISPDKVAQLVVGESELGFLIRGTLDLDNADNVTRACLYLGVDVDRGIPIRLARWLADQPYMPMELTTGTSNSSVSAWLRYRRELYSRFYEASDEEIARQAFLQHLMRRARADGLPRRTLVYNTDESLLNEIAARNRLLASLVQRYRLLEPPIRLAKIDLLDDNELRCISAPKAVAWIERHLSSRGLHAVVAVSSRRFALATNAYSLFPPAQGALHIFTLSSAVHPSILPEWMATKLPGNLGQAERIRRIAVLLGNAVPSWVKERPWLAATGSRREQVHDNLKHVGDWGFRGTRNESFHAYPSTFVHAIPASLINELGLRGELVVDPFGGTGQTALEALKYGGTAVSADSNAVACLVARARLNYLPLNVRARLRSYEPAQIMECNPIEAPSFDRADRWFHPRTIKELCRIRRFIQTRRDNVARDFLYACFSAILAQCSSRRGKENSYFADNTPLPKGVEKPTHVDAVGSFLERIRRNISLVERLYAVLEREGRDPKVELTRVSVRQLDATMAEPHDYGLKPNSVAAIITSPPYLCMCDYTLGQRLSYHWMQDWSLDADFGYELGARRQRLGSDKERVIERYLSGLGRFVERTGALLRPGGYIAIVIGNSMARAFNKVDVPKELDRLLERAGFRLLWQHWREIHWHRTHNLARLKEERVSVHVLPG